MIYVTVKSERSHGVIDEFEIAARTRETEGLAVISVKAGERMVLKRLREQHYDTRDIGDLKYWVQEGDHFALVVMKAHAGVGK